MGWDVVVKKDEFKEGDLCVFFEVDSVLPDGESWAEFMRKKKFRVKTCKLRGVLSQGLALTTDILPRKYRKGLIAGKEVTEILGIKKYEPPLHDGGAKMGQMLGLFPHYIPKTDEIRLQSCLPVLNELNGKPYVITVKCDGTSSTYVHRDGELFACSRNYAKREDDTNIYWAMARKYNLVEKLAEHPNLAVQGEICGPGIQRNPLMLKDIDLFVFTVYDVEAKKRLEYDAFVEFCDDLSLQRAPDEEQGDAFNYTLEKLLELAKGNYEGTDRRREGLVIRSRENIYSPTLQGPLSFKVINNDFLLKDER